MLSRVEREEFMRGVGRVNGTGRTSDALTGDDSRNYMTAQARGG